jgi:competence protein ComEA
MAMLKKILALFLMLYAAATMAAVDANKATDAQLDALKGIGPATSKAILTERKKGDFKNWQDFIDRVKGIGDKKAETLSKEGLTVNGESYKGAMATANDQKKDAKAAAKDEKKDAKATAKEEKKEAKAKAKEEKKAAEAKKDAAVAKSEAKKDAKEAKADAKKDAASAKK